MKQNENQTIEEEDLDVVYVNINGELVPLVIEDDVDIDTEGDSCG